LTIEKNEKENQVKYKNELLTHCMKNYEEEQKKSANLELQLRDNTRSLNNLIALKSSITDLTNSTLNNQKEVTNDDNTSNSPISKEKKNDVNR
jgi:hypothetical protein